MASILKCPRCKTGMTDSTSASGEAASDLSASGRDQSKGIRPARISVDNAPPNAGGCGELGLMLIIFFSCDYLLINRGSDTGTNLLLLLLSLLLTTAAGAVMSWVRKGERKARRAARRCVQCGDNY